MNTATRHGNSSAAIGFVSVRRRRQTHRNATAVLQIHSTRYATTSVTLNVCIHQRTRLGGYSIEQEVARAEKWCSLSDRWRCECADERESRKRSNRATPA